MDKSLGLFFPLDLKLGSRQHTFRCLRKRPLFPTPPPHFQLSWGNRIAVCIAWIPGFASSQISTWTLRHSDSISMVPLRTNSKTEVWRPDASSRQVVHYFLSLEKRHEWLLRVRSCCQWTRKYFCSWVSQTKRLCDQVWKNFCLANKLGFPITSPFLQTRLWDLVPKHQAFSRFRIKQGGAVSDRFTFVFTSPVSEYHNR